MELLELACEGSVLTLRAADQLARMQRGLRAMRYTAETEIERAKAARPRRAAGGGPELSAL
ncbi:hypothetical protein EYE35_17245 [Cereibacter sphaeroides]|nr:hypothetical protein EYE35_17245 [Cereibacter sphaeroides]